MQYLSSKNNASVLNGYLNLAVSSLNIILQKYYVQTEFRNIYLAKFHDREFGFPDFLKLTNFNFFWTFLGKWNSLDQNKTEK